MGSRSFATTGPRYARQAADDPTFTSIVDNPPQLVRVGRKHGPGLIILGGCAESEELSSSLSLGNEHD